MIILEHITDIDKKKYKDRCKDNVKTTLALENIELTDHELGILTEEIMDTSLVIGGDYGDEDIRSVTRQYINSDFLPRFQRAHRQ